MFIAGGEKSESLEELLREAGEEFEFLKTTISYENLQVRRQSWFWKTGSPPVWPRKRKVSLDGGGDENNIGDEAGVCVFFPCCLYSGCDILILLR